MYFLLFDPVTLSIIALAISAGSLLISILGFVWTVKRDRRDRAMIKASAALETSFVDDYSKRTTAVCT